MKKILEITIYSILVMSLAVACKNTTSGPDRILTQSTDTAKTSYSTTLDFDRTVLQILDQSPLYNSFLKLVNAVEFFDELSALNNVMIFVPTDEAFGPSKGLINELSSPDNLPVLRSIINYHIVQADLDVDNILAQLRIQDGPLRLETLNGGRIALSLNQGKLQILDEKTNITYLGTSSIRGTNGIVYTIDRVMRPNSNVPSVSNTAMAPSL
ncbi:MAG: fasciclin domain-containing protein [Muriicola sp.]|nr:fasciclin domain-containing protein [Muriicola sp.]